MQMFTQQRLTKAYKDAKVKYFDENSKYIFFSDCHRGDDSMTDEFARNQVLMVSALRYYYKNGFTYVEAGDGDDLWEHKEFKYIRAAHTDVFTAMKAFYDKGRMIMLYGNHNNMLKNRVYVKNHYYHFYDEYEDKIKPLFEGMVPIESLLLRHRKTGQEILTLHGHQGDLMNDQLAFINMLLLRYFWRYMHLVGFKNPASPAKNMLKRHKVEKHYNKWLQNHKIMLICGHTHRLKFPKPGQLPYFNIGCCLHSKGITGIELVNDQIMIVQWRAQADDTGDLRVVRNVIRGPKPVSYFDRRKEQKK